MKQSLSYFGHRTAILARTWWNFPATADCTSPNRCCGLSYKTVLNRQCPVGYFDGTDLAPVFRSNAAVLAPCYAREAISLMEEMPELTFVIPSEGNWHTMLAYAIPVRSTERTAAYALLDFLCQPSNLARNSIYSGWSTPSSPAFSLLDPKLQQNPLLYPGGRHMTGDLLPATKFRSFQKGCRLNWPPEPVS